MDGLTEAAGRENSTGYVAQPLTDELDRFVLTKVESGRYENASEVVRAALRTLEREEQQFEAKVAGLRAAVDEGDASGIAEGDVFARVREALHLSVPR